MIKKTIILLVLYFFAVLPYILANLTNSQEPEPLEKKTGVGAGADWEKNQEPEPLEKKVRRRSR